MSKWWPEIVAEDLAVDRNGKMLRDGAGYPLLRGASNYYSVFCGIAWMGFAIPVWQGPIVNHLTGQELED